MISWLELGETKHNFHQILIEKKIFLHIDGLVQERRNSIAISNGVTSFLH